MYCALHTIRRRVFCCSSGTILRFLIQLGSVQHRRCHILRSISLFESQPDAKTQCRLRPCHNLHCVFLILCIRKQFFHRGVKDLCNVHRQFQGWVVLAFSRLTMVSRRTPTSSASSDCLKLSRSRYSFSFVTSAMLRVLSRPSARMQPCARLPSGSASPSGSSR